MDAWRRITKEIQERIGACTEHRAPSHHFRDLMLDDSDEIVFSGNSPIVRVVRKWERTAEPYIAIDTAAGPGESQCLRLGCRYHKVATVRGIAIGQSAGRQGAF